MPPESHFRPETGEPSSAIQTPRVQELPPKPPTPDESFLKHIRLQLNQIPETPADRTLAENSQQPASLLPSDTSSPKPLSPAALSHLEGHINSSFKVNNGNDGKTIMSAIQTLNNLTENSSKDIL